MNRVIPVKNQNLVNVVRTVRRKMIPARRRRRKK